tara:strand:- start:234 stop:491 length:258 start_codon:yes stop_codon:yes gene_type:complete
MLKIAAIVLVGLFLGTVILGGPVLDRLADKVIERMEKPYSPSPYGPGLDPDKLDGFRTSIEDQSGEPVKYDEEEWLDRWEKSRRD